MKTTTRLIALVALASTMTVQAADWKQRLNDMRSQVMDVSIDEDESYQAILDYEAKRIQHLQSKLNQHQARLQDHDNGRHLLDADTHAKLTHQSKLYQRHLTLLQTESKKEKLEKVAEAQELFRTIQKDKI